MSLIQLTSVNKKFRTQEIIRDFNLTIDQGEFIALVGPYGCGKSTLFRLISGLDANYNGKILINGNSPEVAKQERRIGYCFQKPTLLPWLTVKDNLLLPYKIAGITNKEVDADKLFSLVNLSSYAERSIKELSGGMQQLVAILRGIILNPDILLLDEPLSSIDEINREKMQDRLLNIHKASKKTTLMITHSISEAIYLSDKVVVLGEKPMIVKDLVPINFSKRNSFLRYSQKFTDKVKKIRGILERK